MTVKLYIGDVLDVLPILSAESIDCVVTSPPYWGLRDYGVAGQIGLESTLGEHLDKMVEVFAAVHRILKPTGTLWINYGDCYAASPNGRSAAATKAAGGDDRTFRDKPFSTVGPIYVQEKENGDRRGNSPCKQHRNKGSNHNGRIVAGGYLKPKDLCMVPNRMAIALQEWGWWVRSEIIWGKPNPMPESVTDRPATAHEKIFLFSKSAKYYYNADGVRQKAAQASIDRWSQDVDVQAGSARANGGQKTNGPMKAVGGPKKNRGAMKVSMNAGATVQRKKIPRRTPPGSRAHTGLSAFEAENHREYESRNLRNYEPPPMQVWRMATVPFKSAHFATYPPELVERCLVAGCPPGGTVLDIFGGAGTTGLVADRHGRDCVLIEINPEYGHIARDRLRTGLVRVDSDLPPRGLQPGPLFERGDA